MTTVFRAPPTVLQFFNNAGLPNVNGTVLTQVGGVNYPTYQDAAGTIALPNPIPLNSRGEVSNVSGQSCQLFLVSGVTYTFTLYDAAGNQIGQYPNISGVIDGGFLSTSFASSIIGWIQAGIGAVVRFIQEKLRERLSVEDFGAVGDGVTDDSTAINAAISAAIPTGRRVYFQAKTYKINSPLLAYVSSTFITVCLQGEQESERSDRGTVIDHSSLTTVPGFMVQGARIVECNDMQFRGPNNFVATNKFAASEFVVGGVRDQQFSPQAAICVDPFANGVPSDGGYPGFAANYTSTALTSTQIKLRRIRFNNQLVGVMLSPTSTAANDENGVIDDVTFENVKVAVAMGEIQSKGMTFGKFFGNTIYTLIDTYSYGARNGSAGFNLSGGDVSGVTALVRTLSQPGANNSVTQNWSINGLYAEGLWTIGWIGDTTQASYYPGAFNDCTFSFAQTDTMRKDAQLTNFAPLTFSRCLFNYATVARAPRALKFYHMASLTLMRSVLTFDKCVFNIAYGPFFNLEGLPFMRMKDVVLERGTATQPGTPALDLWTDQMPIGSTNDIANSTVWGPSFIEDAGAAKTYRIPAGMNAASMGTVNITPSGFGATFTANDATILQIQDAVYITTHPLEKIDGTTFNAATWCYGIITNIVSTTITLNDVSTNAPSGSQAATLEWYPVFHDASTITTNSNASVTIATGGPSWLIGHRIINADIPAGAYIASGTTPNFTLSKAATGTHSGVRCYDANVSVVTKTSL